MLSHPVQIWAMLGEGDCKSNIKRGSGNFAIYKQKTHWININYYSKHYLKATQTLHITDQWASEGKMAVLGRGVLMWILLPEEAK